MKKRKQSRLRNLHKEEKEAYMTVESAMILPMVLCLYIMLIYTSFYLYDRCLFRQDAGILCFRESIRREEGAPKPDPEQVLQNTRRQFGTKYFAVSGLETSARAEGKRVILQGSARVLPTSFGSYFLMPKNIWTLSFQAKARKTDPPWSIRSFRRKTFLVREGLERIENIAKSR